MAKSSGSDVSLVNFIGFFGKQVEALKATTDHRYLLYGGTRGAGKSYLLRWALIVRLVDWYKRLNLTGVRVMLACESYPTLRDRQITKISTEFPNWLGELAERQSDGLGYYLHERWGGGVIALRNLDDPQKYVGGEYAAIGVDQLEKIPLDTFNILRGSLRWPGIDRTFLLGTGNPGGIGHNWNVAYFIEKNYPPELQSMAGEFIFVRARPDDNKFLSQEYWATELNTLPDRQRKAWVEGDYYAFSGQGFPTWSDSEHVIDPFVIPEGWPRWRAVDWGYNAPFCCLWFTKDVVSGRVYVYREVYEKQLTDRNQARMIRELSAGETIYFSYADPKSFWNKKNMLDIVTTSADEYAAEGIYLVKADNDRLSGKRKVDRLLEKLPDGKPGIQVFRNCANLIRTMPTLVAAENNPEDIDTNQDDHAYDTLKYGLTNQRPLPNQEKDAQRKRRVHQMSPLEQVKGVF